MGPDQCWLRLGRFCGRGISGTSFERRTPFLLEERGVGTCCMGGEAKQYEHALSPYDYCFGKGNERMQRTLEKVSGN